MIATGSWAMDVGMSINVSAIRVPASSLKSPAEGFARPSLITTRTTSNPKRRQRKVGFFVVEAKGRRGFHERQFQRPPPPPLPDIEDDGNPRFVIFIRMANFYFWYPLSMITGGTIAKIMVAAKNNFLGKYIYRDTLSKNLASVIYRDEKDIRKSAIKQYRVLRSATEFRYGYKLVENTNLRAALTTKDIIELPTPDKLKTVLDKLGDFFGNAKESFGKLRAISSSPTDEKEGIATQKTKSKR